jgi:recombinational DNA repair protein (RecF pathway)
MANPKGRQAGAVHDAVCAQHACSTRLALAGLDVSANRCCSCGRPDGTCATASMIAWVPSTSQRARTASSSDSPRAKCQ